MAKDFYKEVVDSDHTREALSRVFDADDNPIILKDSDLYGPGSIDGSVAKKILSSDGASVVSYERCEEIRKKIMDR